MKITSEVIEFESLGEREKLICEISDKQKVCPHKNIDRQDGLDECLDCGVRNY